MLFDDSRAWCCQVFEQETQGVLGLGLSMRDLIHVVPLMSLVVAMTYSIPPSSIWERKRSAAISAYVTPPRKNTSVIRFSPCWPEGQWKDLCHLSITNAFPVLLPLQIRTELNRKIMFGVKTSPGPTSLDQCSPLSPSIIHYNSDMLKQDNCLRPKHTVKLARFILSVYLL